MNSSLDRSAARMDELDKFASLLDSRFSLFGVRFGIDPVLGLIPGIGDAVGFIMSSAIVMQAWRIGVRKRTLARMMLNIAGDSILGAIPLVGTVTDVLWKANRSNLRLIRRDFERNGARRMPEGRMEAAAPT